MAYRSFSEWRGFLKGPEGVKAFFHRGTLSPPASSASLAIGMQVACEPHSGPTGPRTKQITVTPLRTPSI